MKCDHCGKQVPEGVFCTVCGAHQGTTAEVGDPKTRHMHFAAAPGEHVGQPSIFTTLFPHLGHGKIHELRYAFLGGLAVVVILTAAGLIVGALLSAIFLVPLLYILYLYEAQVYRDQPGTVLGFTLGGGIVLGVAFGVVSQLLIPASRESNTGQVLVNDVLLPVIQLVLMPLPALLLRGSKGFPETIDGLVFGTASGLGFSAALGVVRFSDVIGSQAVRNTDPGTWIYTMITAAVLVPLLLGTSSGIAAAALWRNGRGPRSGTLAAVAIPFALVVDVAFYLVGQVLSNQLLNGLIVIAFEAVPVAVLLVYARYLLHHSLLEEAADFGFTATVCPNCHKHVIAAGFCPSCGRALTAAPRAMQGAVKPAAAAAAPSGSGEGS